MVRQRLTIVNMKIRLLQQFVSSDLNETRIASKVVEISKVCCKNVASCFVASILNSVVFFLAKSGFIVSNLNL